MRNDVNIISDVNAVSNVIQFPPTRILSNKKYASASNLPRNRHRKRQYINMHSQLSCGVRWQHLGLRIHLVPKFMHERSEGSVESVAMCRLVCAVADRLCDKYAKLEYAQL